MVFQEVSSAASLARGIHVTHRQLTSMVHRALNLQQCRDDLDDLAIANPELGAALDNYGAEFDDSTFNCFQSSDICSVNEDNFPSTPLYAQACANAGGSIFEYDYILSCTISADGQTESFTLETLNVDVCFPKTDSCSSPSTIAGGLASETNEALDELELLVGLADGASLSCTFDLTLEDSSGNVLFRESGNTGSSAVGFGAAYVVGIVAMATAFLVL